MTPELRTTGGLDAASALGFYHRREQGRTAWPYLTPLLLHGRLRIAGINLVDRISCAWQDGILYATKVNELDAGYRQLVIRLKAEGA